MDTTEKPKVEDAGPPPWEEAKKMADSTKHYVVEKFDQVVNKAKSMLPWEEAQAVAKNPPKPPPPPAIDRFDKVFANLIQQESGGNHTDAKGKLTTSNKGATGVTQLMPATMADPGYGVTPLRNKSKEEYLRFGKDYLKAMLTEFNGDYAKALAAYNYGPGGVKKAIETSANKGGSWLSHTPNETKEYVTKIMQKL